MGKGPGGFSDIGKKAKDLLFRDYTSDHKLSLSTTTASGIKFNSTHLRKGDDVASDVKAELKVKGVDTEIKLDSKSRILVKAEFDDVAPGLKVTLSGVAPDPKSTKAEFKYKGHHLEASGNATVVSKPVVEGSVAVGTSKVAVGGEVGFDTTSNAATKYSLGLSVTDSSYIAAIILADKGDTLKASYYHKVKSDLAVAVEAVHKRTKQDTTFTAGAQFKLDELTDSKVRFNNRGLVAGLVQYEFRPKSTLTVSGELDSKNVEKPVKVGMNLSLKL